MSLTIELESNSRIEEDVRVMGNVNKNTNFIRWRTNHTASNPLMSLGSQKWKLIA
jgi:hypothetical protein